ncbi:tripartite motif-containing protein 34-like [Mizuhopecten yessoensis]|uniref:Tripartite motif-containing protein 3 n=1 Tax=Mizuhopecten yessoensis TaxID=6573 RepID=A0A210Q9I6_MIZYE|nr:tripartite motif-containing protein 34-like [Mizuhopecten yessoensis]OWF45394.1 Tripartite motif-containing protein 3 [Mizuhopecten yessoensis]
MEEVLQTFYQCGICQESITYPKKLKCQHVFCHECLVVYITHYFGKASFPCPVCHYKHLPEEQKTVITQDTLLILEEDSLMRDVRLFFKDGEKPQPIYNADGINRVPCTIHTDSLCGYFCPDCNLLVCTQCKREMHPHCHLRQIDKRMRMEAYSDIRKVTADLTDFLSEAETVHTDLNSKVGNICHNSPERVETIKLYYSDLKEKVVKYLEEQEREVLEKKMKLEEKEKAHLENDIGVCSKMVTSVESRQRLAHVVHE